MKNYLKTSMILALICAFAAIILASLNSVTAPIIVAYENQKTIDALQAVSHGYDLGDKVLLEDEISPYYIPLMESSNVNGYLLELGQNGYGGKITLVASYDNDGKLLEAKVVSSSETPGLGKKSENEGYMDKYINNDIIPTNKTQLSGADASTVSGASITFSAIGKALAAGSEFIKTLGGK